MGDKGGPGPFCLKDFFRIYMCGDYKLATIGAGRAVCLGFCACHLYDSTFQSIKPQDDLLEYLCSSYLPRLRQQHTTAVSGSHQTVRWSTQLGEKQNSWHGIGPATRMATCVTSAMMTLATRLRYISYSTLTATPPQERTQP